MLHSDGLASWLFTQTSHYIEISKWRKNT